MFFPALAGRAGVREGIAFFIWMGIFNVFVISQFWAFDNDIYTEGQGGRLFSLIGVGASTAGGSARRPSSRSSAAPDFTPYTLMLHRRRRAAVALGPRRGEPARIRPAPPQAHESVKLNDAPTARPARSR